MAKSRSQKEEQLQKVESLLDNKGVVFFSYHGLAVVDQEVLRGKLREEQAKMTVAKRTLLTLALSNRGIEIADDLIDGPVAIATGDDEVAPAKVISEFKKNFESIVFYGGILEESFVDSAQVENLASLPSKEQLLAQLVGSLASPMSGFLTVLSGNSRKLVNVLSAIKDAKEA